MTKCREGHEFSSPHISSSLLSQCLPLWTPFPFLEPASFGQWKMNRSGVSYMQVEAQNTSVVTPRSRCLHFTWCHCHCSRIVQARGKDFEWPWWNRDPGDHTEKLLRVRKVLSWCFPCQGSMTQPIMTRLIAGIETNKRKAFQMSWNKLEISKVNAEVVNNAQVCIVHPLMECKGH